MGSKASCTPAFMDINAARILDSDTNWSFYAQNVCCERVPEGERCRWMSTLHLQPTKGRNLETTTAFKGRRGGGRKWKRKTATLLIINSAEFWSWEARGKYIDVWKMLIKERSTLWFGRYLPRQFEISLLPGLMVLVMPLGEHGMKHRGGR